MKIGVMSDTHLSEPSVRLKKIVEVIFADADMILHAGDIVGGPVLAYLEASGVIAVRGNMDRSEVTRVLPIKRVVEAGGKKIGLIHGHGAPRGLAEALRKEFDRIDCLVFGHSHEAMNRRVGDELLFNPGSAERTVGLLHVGTEIEGEIIEVG